MMFLCVEKISHSNIKENNILNQLTFSVAKNIFKNKLHVIS